MTTPQGKYTPPAEKPVSDPPGAPTRLLKVNMPTETPPSYSDLIAQAKLLHHLARHNHQTRREAIYALQKLIDAGCAPGTWYLKQGKYLVVEQKADGTRTRRYIGADPEAQKTALSPYRRYRTYLEILDLVGMLDRLTLRLHRSVSDLADQLEHEYTILQEKARTISKKAAEGDLK